MSVLLSVADLRKHFRSRGRLVRAVDGVSFDLAAGETLGLVGESGCGKSTLGKAIVRVHPPTSGSVRLDGEEIADLSPRRLVPHRRRMQIIFQDPYSSLNPRRRIGDILREPLDVHGVGSRAERRERVAWLIDRVGLRPDQLDRYPHEFSGGQRQRIGIARALALNPALIVCDEPVSALDVSVQAQVLNLLADLRDEFELAYLFVSHDLSVVRHIADRVMVMYLGQVVEIGPRDEVLERPVHPYTQALLAAAPRLEPEWIGRLPLAIEGDLPSPADPPAGCRFHTRCPFATLRCRTEAPLLLSVGAGRQVACHEVRRDAAGIAGGPDLAATLGAGGRGDGPPP